MRLTIFGATGGTGTALVEQALAAGHHVTAVVRDPSRLSAPRRVLTARRDCRCHGSGIDRAVRRRSRRGRVRARPRGRGPTTVTSEGARSIVDAMEKGDARRLIVITGSIVDDTGNGFFMTRVVKPLARHTFLADVCTDMRRAEDIVHATDLDWTIVRPPRLTDRPATGKYRAAVDRNVPRGVKIPRADVATYVLDHLADLRTFRKHVFVAT